MNRFVSVLCLLLGVSASFTVPRAAEMDTGSVAPDLQYSLGFGAGLQSGNGLQFGISRGVHAVHLGLGLIYDDRDAEFGYSTGLRYHRTLYMGRYNDTYAWSGGAVTGNYRNETSAHVTSFGAGLGFDFHAGLPIHIRIDSGLSVHLDKNFSDAQYVPALNLAVLYVW